MKQDIFGDMFIIHNKIKGAMNKFKVPRNLRNLRCQAPERISMLEDEEGFEYPQIDENKCVRCYQCIRVCPLKAARAQ